MNLDLPSLEAFEAVVEHGSIGAAAKQLNKTTSAISYHLRRLEEQLQIPVWDRNGYRLSLTPEGYIVLNQVRVILQKSRDLITLRDQLRQGWEANLAIFFDGSLPIEWILGAIQEVEDTGAPTRIDLRVGIPDQIQSEFRSFKGDLLVTNDVIRNPGLLVEELPPMEHVLCCGPHHPLAHTEKPSLDDLRSQTELIVQNTATLHERPRPFFGSRRVFRLSDFNAKLAAIQQGLGYGWLPLHLAEDRLRNGLICEILYSKGSRYSRVPAIVTRAGLIQGLALQKILDHLRQTGVSDKTDLPPPI